ncbi:MAG TPA: hypothetical protein VHD91_04920 [Gaiellaceae bacterium]|nr:hypothetical protein [Gaiellaceae bacterium]
MALVPVPVQHAIHARAAASHVAYVPARGAPPYRYRDWKLQSGVLRILFANRNEPRKLVVFQAQRFQGVCRAGATHSYQMAGVKVWYGESGGRRQAWRCVNGAKVSAWTTLPELRFAAVGLARIAASGHRV